MELLHKMDYLAFISDIDEIWTEQTNSKIAQKYSMNRSVLPALINLHRQWKEFFDLETSNYNRLELELNHFKSNQNLSSNVELEKKNRELKKVVEEIQEENYNLEKKIRVLESKNNDLQNKSLFKKIVG